MFKIPRVGKRYRDEQYIKWTRGGVDEHGAQTVENVQTDMDKPVVSISGPHNSDDEDSSPRRMNTCGSVCSYQRLEGVFYLHLQGDPLASKRHIAGRSILKSVDCLI
jgi:hypothetical protein